MNIERDASSILTLRYVLGDRLARRAHDHQHRPALDSQRVDFGMNIQEAIDAPRFHHQWLPDRIRCEPWACDPVLLRRIGARAANPKSPLLLTRVHSLDLGGQAGSIAAHETRAFVANPEKGSIALLDISDIANPVVLTRFGAIPFILQLALRDDYLYVHAASSIDYLGGIYVFDVSTDTPFLAGQYLTDLIDPGFYLTRKGVAFLARTPTTGSDSAKIDCIDMSDPADPVLLDSWESPYPGNITDIHIDKRRLFCSAYWGGVWMLDATDLGNLKLLARFDRDDPQPFAVSIRARRGLAFVAEGGPQQIDEKFCIFRFRGSSLELIREIPATAFTQSIDVSGGLVVFAEIESPWQTTNPVKTVYLSRFKKAPEPRE